MTTWEIIVLVLLVLGIQAGLGIIMERRNPTSTLAWLLILILVPVVGVPLYLLIGRLRVTRRIRRFRRLGEVDAHLDSPEPLHGVVVHLDRVDAATARLAVGLDGPPLRAGNVVRLLQDGAHTFDALEEAIQEAKRYVHLEFFIFNPGETGRRFRDLLAAAARRGVEVRILLDAFGSYRMSGAYLRPILEAGGHYASFAPVRFSRLRRRPDFRNHRKILVVDGRIGFVGGFNIMDEYVTCERPGTPWRDTHLQLEGPIVHDLECVLAESWYTATREVLATPEYFPEARCAGDVLAQVVAGGPDTSWPSIEKVYTSALYAARKNLFLTTPYFVPTEAVVNALINASLRGVDVRLLVPQKGDHILVDWAGRSYYPEIMEAGGRIFEYGPRLIHSKTLSVDGRFCIIGTANLDIRSFRLNYEVSTFVYDAGITAELERDFERDLGESRPIEPDSFRERPLVERFRENTARLLSPLL